MRDPTEDLLGAYAQGSTSQDQLDAVNEALSHYYCVREELEALRDLARAWARVFAIHMARDHEDGVRRHKEELDEL